MFKQVLFCTDFSESSHWAFTYALNLAKKYAGTLLIVHVTPQSVDIYRPTEQIEDVVRNYHKKVVDEEVKKNYLTKMQGFKKYKLLLKDGIVYDEIIKTAKEESADVIVMGAHGRTALDHLLMGSTAEKVVRKSPIPVLTVRLPEDKLARP